MTDIGRNTPLSGLAPDQLRVAAWSEIRELLEKQLAPLGRHAIAALAPQSGEDLLDIGCGGGETTLELARAVAPDGMVAGIDLSAAVLAFAERAAQACRRVRFIQADAQTYPFKSASFDAAAECSRMSVSHIGDDCCVRHISAFV